MDLSFFPLTLEAIDQAAAESLCLFIGADERPLTGLAGLTDWRVIVLCFAYFGTAAGLYVVGIWGPLILSKAQRTAMR